MHVSHLNINVSLNVSMSAEGEEEWPYGCGAKKKGTVQQGSTCRWKKEEENRMLMKTREEGNLVAKKNK